MITMLAGYVAEPVKYTQKTKKQTKKQNILITMWDVTVY